MLNGVTWANLVVIDFVRCLLKAEHAGCDEGHLDGHKTTARCKGNVRKQDMAAREQKTHSLQAECVWRAGKWREAGVLLGDDPLTLHSWFGPVRTGSPGSGPLLNLEPDLGSGSALNCGIPTSGLPCTAQSSSRVLLLLSFSLWV